MSFIIEIDNREPSIIKNWFKSNNYKFELKNLELGDFIIRDDFNNILLIIERKTIEDLLASVKDGRYIEQSQRYLQLNLPSNKIYYIIEGNINRYAFDSIEYKTVYSCIYSLSFKKGFSVFFQNNTNETINFISQFLNRIISNNETFNNNENQKNNNNNNNDDKKDNETVPISLIKKANVSKDNLDCHMLNLIPGIGMGTAKEILSKFNNSFFELWKSVKEDKVENENNLNQIKVNNRKLSKKIIENINSYLV